MKTLMYLLRLLLTTGLSNREIGRQADVSPNTARRYRDRLQAIGLTWEAVKTLDEEALDAFRKSLKKLSFADPTAGQSRMSNRPGWSRRKASRISTEPSVEPSSAATIRQCG